MIARSALLLLATASATAAQTPDSGTFTLVQNGQTVVSEEFTRSAERLRVTATIPGQVTMLATADLRSDASVAGLTVEVYGPGGTSGEPAQSSMVVFRDGTATVTGAGGPGADASVEVGEGAVAYLNPSPSMLEQILRRARAIGGDSVQVPLWLPSQGAGQAASATVTFSGDEAILMLGGVRIELTTDDDGRLLAGRIPAQGVEIRRE